MKVIASTYDMVHRHGYRLVLSVCIISALLMLIHTPYARAQIGITVGSDIQGHCSLNQTIINNSRIAINQLEPDQLAGNAGTILEYPNQGNDKVRIDRQGYTSDNMQNIQIQTGNATCAGVLVPINLLYPSGEHQEGELRNKVRGALSASLSNKVGEVWKFRNLTGSFSN